MKQIDLVSFIDKGSSQDGFVAIRAGNGQIALALSLEDDGDLEVILDPNICEQIVKVMQKAIQVVKAET